MIIFPGTVRQKWNFQRRWGVIGKIPSVGGMDIFWNYTVIFLTRYFSSKFQGKDVCFLVSNIVEKEHFWI